MANHKKKLIVFLVLALFIINFAGIASAQGTVTLKISTVSLDSTYGEEVTFDVTALDPALGGTTPSGALTLRDGTQDLTTAALTAAEPVITTSNGTPVIQWGAYTYWAYSYQDNRLAFNIVAYDASRNKVQEWEATGARYLSRITMDAVAKTFTFLGQDSKTVTVNWSDLLSASASVSLKTSALGIGSHTITVAFPGDGSHDASEASVTYNVHPTYTVVYNGNGNTGGEVPANGSSYKGTKAAVAGNGGNLVKTGYAFMGWNTQADGRGTHYNANTEGTVTSDVTLYAQWSKVLDVGTGTENNPYLIRTSEELDSIRNYLNQDLYFKLIADIDLVGQEWPPIGDQNNKFIGHLDGNGRKITGLTINRPNNNYVGLFGYAYYDASISNLNLENVNVTGKQEVGGLVGRNYGGVISNSYVTGSVTGNGANVGGLIGYNNDGEIDNSFSLARVTGTGNNVGGLTGSNTGTISYSYATGSVTGSSNSVGGLIGSNGGTISYGYATGSVTGAGMNIGGLIGYGGGSITNSFYDASTTGQSDTGKGLGQTTAQMKLQSTYANWDFTSTWGISTARNNGYPYLQAIQKFVTYDGNGNTDGNAPTDSKFYPQGATVSVSGNTGNLLKAGYTFAGWNTKADGTGTNYAAGAAFSMGLSDVTLYANWTLIPTYTVTYNGNGNTGGNVPTDSGSYEQGDTVSVSGDNGNLARAHYTFAGWNTQADGDGTDYAAGATFNMGSAGVTLYAKWLLNPTYAVIYNGNESTGGNAPTDSGSYEQGDTVSVSGNNGNLVRAHYAFAGWNTQADGTGTDYAAGATFSMGAADVTLYAQWNPTYTVTYNGNGSTGGNVPTDSGSYEQGDTVSVPGNGGNLVKTHYAFAGWNTQADGDGTDYAAGATFNMGSSDVTLYAQWIVKPTYTVTYNANGSAGGSIPTDSGSYEQGDTTPVSGNTGNLVKSGYTFAGWNTKADGTGTNYAAGAAFSMGLSDVTLYAQWAVYTPTQPTTPTSDPKFISTDGHLTLPAGKPGEVSQGDEIKIVIPANATGKELKLTIDKILDTKELTTSKDVLLSPVFEILKNFSENFDKPVTLSFRIDLNSLQGNEKPVVFYYDEAKKVWVRVGGTVSGNNITVDVNHFTKYAVFAVDDTPPTTDGSTKASFSDIAGHWAEASIKQAVNAGIVGGYPDGTFKPGRTVTRAEFAVMLINALKLQADGAELTFTDKAKIASWAEKSVAQAVHAGIISGYEDGSFRPNAEITRAEMAAMIAKALSLTAESAAATGFADDKDIPAWAKGAVAAMNKLGLIEGKGANRFAPGDKTTRAEAVTVLLKMPEQKSK